MSFPTEMRRIVDAFLRHPLLLGFVASLMTIGATAYLDHQRQAREERAAAIREVDDGLALMAHARITADVLGTALNYAGSRDCATVERLRINHEKAYIEWNTRLSDHIAGLARYYGTSVNDRGAHCLMRGLMSEYTQKADGEVMGHYDRWRREHAARGEGARCEDAFPTLDMGFIHWLRRCEIHVRRALYDAVDARDPQPERINAVFEACGAPVPDDLYCG